MITQTNFEYLKAVDKNLYEIITEAEKLYRDEYFEQCMTQTRRFGEHICRNVLGKSRTTEITFDEMLATLKDKINGSEQEKEFIDDLYFLKKQGNESTHSATVGKNSIKAFECLKRAFEAGINYAVYYKKSDSDFLKLEYDSELLITGKKSKETLAKKYEKQKEKFATVKKSKNDVKGKKQSKKTPAKPLKKQIYTMNSISQKHNFSPFWIFLGIAFLISFGLIIFLLI